MKVLLLPEALSELESAVRYYRAVDTNIPYIVRGDMLWALAFAHARQAPEYWIDRTPEQP